MKIEEQKFFTPEPPSGGKKERQPSPEQRIFDADQSADEALIQQVIKKYNLLSKPVLEKFQSALLMNDPEKIRMALLEIFHYRVLMDDVLLLKLVAGEASRQIRRTIQTDPNQKNFENYALMREIAERYTSDYDNQGLVEGSDTYWHIWNKVVKGSTSGDVTFQVNRFQLNSHLPPDLLDRISKRGWLSTAKSYLDATSPERMKYGKMTLVQRLEKAEEAAVKAGVDFNDLAARMGLEIRGYEKYKAKKANQKTQE
ncbi:hypothetical protein HY933_02230 [Candidatus Falkowbacteria bacterium]|nr:hypothetical protein [Candidatus Falkowbacteria bacterium]